jgi:hypothetical protein
MVLMVGARWPMSAVTRFSKAMQNVPLASPRGQRHNRDHDDRRQVIVHASSPLDVDTSAGPSGNAINSPVLSTSPGEDSKFTRWPPKSQETWNPVSSVAASTVIVSSSPRTLACGAVTPPAAVTAGVVVAVESESPEQPARARAAMAAAAAKAL